MIRVGAAVAAAGGLAGLGYYLVVTGKATVDTGWGRRVRPLGPFGVQIAAPAATVFDVIAAPYLGRTPRAMAGKLQVLQRGTDMVLAEHYTPVHRGKLTAATLETVTFDRPHAIGIRLIRGPVPYITEQFALTGHDGGTRLDYSGELGTDFGIAGQWWAGRVAAAWEAAVPVLLQGHPGRGGAPRQTRDRPFLTFGFCLEARWLRPDGPLLAGPPARRPRGGERIVASWMGYLARRNGLHGGPGRGALRAPGPARFPLLRRRRSVSRSFPAGSLRIALM